MQARKDKSWRERSSGVVPALRAAQHQQVGPSKEFRGEAFVVANRPLRASIKVSWNLPVARCGGSGHAKPEAERAGAHVTFRARKRSMTFQLRFEVALGGVL